MDEAKKNLEPWERLIENESQAALERFRRLDFRAALERRLKFVPRPAPWFRRPLPMAAGLAAALLLALGISVFTSFLAMKREVRELKEVLMRLPELRTPLAALSPVPVDEETARLIRLSWVFRLAGKRLDGGPGTDEEWRSALETAFAAPGTPTASEWRLRGMAKTERLLLEKRIRALIAAGELQRLRARNKSNQL